MSAPSKHKNHRFRLAGLLVALGSLSGGLAQACEIRLSEPPAPVLIDYNPFAPVLARELLGMEFENASTSPCALEITFQDMEGQPTPDFEMGGATVEFQPRESSGLRRAELATHTYSVNIPAEGAARVDFDATLKQPTVIPPGHYNIEFRLAVGEPQQQPMIVIPVSLVLTSAPRAQLNIAGVAGAFGSVSSLETLDFGEAETGAVRHAFLQVRANNPSTVAFDSEHHGRLAHVELGKEGSNIAYFMDLAGEAIDLRSLARFKVEPPRTLEGVSLPMTFTLGPVEGAMSGRYQDIITVTINPD